MKSTSPEMGHHRNWSNEDTRQLPDNRRKRQLTVECVTLNRGHVSGQYKH